MSHDDNSKIKSRLSVYAFCLLTVLVMPGAARADFVDSTETPSSQTKPLEPQAPSQEDNQSPVPPDKVSQGSPATSPQKPTPPPPENAKGAPSKQRGLLSDDVTKHDDSAPIEVKGDVVKGLRSMGRLDLEGNVEILQSGARLLSDSATVLTDPGSSRTNKAIARGNVKFSKESTIHAPPLKAEAQEMQYFVPERKIVMTGKPRVWRGQELIQGKQITLDLDTGSVTIQDARGVVEPSNLSEKER